MASRAWEDPDVAEPNTPSSGSRDDGADPEDGPTGRVARTRERVERTRGQVADVAERVVAARPDTPLIDTAFEIHERDSRIAGGMLAGAIAFRLFLLLVPLLLILVAGLGFLHLSDAERATSQQLDLSEALVSTMQTVGENAARGRWITLWVGLVAAVFAIRTMIKSLRIVHNLAWGTSAKVSANQPKAVLAGLGVTILIVVYTLAAQWLRAHTPGGGVLASVVTGAGAVGVWMIVQLLLPRAEGATWIRVLPGAVLVGIGLQALHAITVFYFAGRVSRMSETYGPLGVAIVALLWLYLIGGLMVSAAVINATLWDRHQRGVPSWAPIDLSLFRP